MDDILHRDNHLCVECGLTSDEVDWLVDVNRHSPLTREQSPELFYATFERLEKAVRGEPCAEAVLDAAGV